LRLAKHLHPNFNLHYYIAPKAWAWNKKRVHKLRKYFKTVNCILPFEIDFFKSFNVNAIYTGNPSVNQVARYQENSSQEEGEYIALFPGSRKQEVERILPVMLEGIKKLDGYTYRISKASNLDTSIYAPFVENSELLYSDNYKLLNGAKAALITSGTATLETALFDVPQVVCYIGNTISYRIAKALVSLKYISLVNLIENKEVIKELIQGDCNPSSIEIELKKILSSEGQETILAGYQSMKNSLGYKNSARTAIENIFTFSSS
jgi:lipid-A-disaccharide synthase